MLAATAATASIAAVAAARPPSASARADTIFNSFHISASSSKGSYSGSSSTSDVYEIYCRMSVARCSRQCVVHVVCGFSGDGVL